MMVSGICQFCDFDGMGGSCMVRRGKGGIY